MTILKKEVRFQINNLTLHCKELEKEEQTKQKTGKRKERIKIWAEISEMEKRKSIEKFNKTTYLFFENINKSDKSSTGWTRKNKRRHK